MPFFLSRNKNENADSGAPRNLPGHKIEFCELECLSFGFIIRLAVDIFHVHETSSKQCVCSTTLWFIIYFFIFTNEVDFVSQASYVLAVCLAQDGFRKLKRKCCSQLCCCVALNNCRLFFFNCYISFLCGVVAQLKN